MNSPTTAAARWFVRHLPAVAYFAIVCVVGSAVNGDERFTYFVYGGTVAAACLLLGAILDRVGVRR